MSLPSELAAVHQRRRAKAADAATIAALRVWRQIDPQELDNGWAVHAPAMVAMVAQAQVQVAAQAIPYMNSVDRYYGRDSDVELVPEMFGGVMIDGRELGPAMYGAVATTKTLTQRVGAVRAFEAGAGFLAVIVGNALHDLGRAADSTLGMGRGYARYVRVLSPGACSRCAVLAGKSSYKVAFKRHPRCKCTAWPVTNSGPGSRTPAGMFDTDADYFHSLSRAEQDRIFTKAGAEAIRNGADVGRVVNARRGAYGIGYSGHTNVPTSGNRLQKLTIGVKADGTPLQVYATTESTTRRGQFGRENFAGPGRRTTTVRLMPEQIVQMAGDDPARWELLLRRYGYIA